MLIQSIIATIASLTLLSPSITPDVFITANGFYSQSAVITEKSDNVISLTDIAGETWVVEDASVSAYQINDNCTLLLYDNNTPDCIYDDVIIAVIK